MMAGESVAGILSLLEEGGMVFHAMFVYDQGFDRAMSDIAVSVLNSNGLSEGGGDLDVTACQDRTVQYFIPTGRYMYERIQHRDSSRYQRLVESLTSLPRTARRCTTTSRCRRLHYETPLLARHITSIREELEARKQIRSFRTGK